MQGLRPILPWVRPYRSGFLWGMGLVALSNLFTVALPWLVQRAVDALALPVPDRGAALRIAAVLVGVAVLGGAAKYGMRELMNGLSRRVECDLRSALFGHLLALDLPFFGRHRTGELMSLATNDTQAVRMAVGPAVMYAVNTAVGFALSMALMLRISPRLTAVVLLPLLALPVVVLLFGRRIQRRFDVIQQRFAEMSTFVQENLTGIRIIRAFSREESQEDAFSRLNDGYAAENMGLARIQGIFQPSLTLLAGTGGVLVLWLGGSGVVAGDLSLGEFVAFGLYLTFLTWPMISLGWVISLFRKGAASMIRIDRILAETPSVATPASPRRTGTIRGGIEFRDVALRHPGSERWILRDVSFRIPAGTTAAIVGGTGSGKSALISLVPRLLDPTAGAVLVDGVDVRERDLGELRGAIGMAPQDPFLFSDTIRANIALGAADPARISEAMRMAALEREVEEFPRGAETVLGERGITLSGGQRQRATLARAIARNPPILILDDTLSAVDARTETAILEALRGVRKGRTTLLVSHRVSAVLDADRIFVLEEGRIAESGTHAELAARAGPYARLLRRQLLEEALGGASIRSGRAGTPE